MPVPVDGLEQHYGADSDVYFDRHHHKGKYEAALWKLKHARALVGGTGTLLDIGAGQGELLQAAQQEGWAVVGIEPLPAFAEYASRLSGVEVRKEPLERCGFDPDSIDVVTLTSVLEHLYDPDETIKEISRILRPGGVLYLDVPNEAGLYFRMANLYQKLRGRRWVVNLSPTFSPYHVFGFTPKSLRTLLSKHNLEPKIWRFYGGASHLPDRSGIVAGLEGMAVRAISTMSRVGRLGNYVEVWAQKH
jgi:2-polyprenyl-3-methyl-5-hydroxy-6-metoxy-1,4-benzoquinol methylase